MENNPPYFQAISLLKRLISTPSFSKEEEETADIIAHFLQQRNVEIITRYNNVWAYNKHFDASKPSLLLNSHHDTVKPNAGYTRDPFAPVIEEGKLYGLGSNDAGGCLVALITAFLHFYALEDLSYNLILACTAEEEISGVNGIASILPELGKIDCGIVGEPTLLEMAIAEKGLMVLDCYTQGASGHAAREEGINAIYLALPAIAWFKDFQFEKISETLGPVKMSVTVVEAGRQHNVVPDQCHFVVDTRTTDAYSNEELLEIIQTHAQCKVVPRSTRLQPSHIDLIHPLVQAGIAMGKSTYGSPTLSDQALMPFPTLKMGPGDSARSHTADEFIYLSEIEKGIETYIALLAKILLG